METLTDQNWLLSVGVFLPMLGVLVMLFIPRGEEALVKLVGVSAAGPHHGGSIGFEASRIDQTPSDSENPTSASILRERR